MKCIQILEPNHAEYIEIPTPRPRAGEVLIRVAASGICGTDLHILRGEYMGGYPVIPGHEFSGTIVEVGEGVSRFRVGDRVAVEPNISCDNCPECLHNRQNFCRNWQAVGVTLPGGMAEYVAVPEKQVFSIGDLPFEQAAFVEPLSCVLHGLEKLSLRPGESVALLGAGPIGIQLLRVARLWGVTHIAVAERNPERLAFARQAGADEAFTNLDELTPDGYDAVIDATGVPTVMARCIDLARPGGRVLWFGVPPSGREMNLEPFKVFRKGLALYGSFTSLRNSYQAVALLQSGRLKVDDIISHRLPLEAFVHGCELIEQGAEGVKKVLVLPGG
ncbi:MAG TPA: L-threonine 3-dehydrogenase [Anaerolinea thermolimosa]|uniref:L-threonine 3-dehydrogenase n=1 Tax=Anaerolinea thermolimosa TaxID=229919 RepID=A0A3D1JHV3_9CHLR|nr:zinc-dependent alcohol dehydrogenase family protein [Anaerolinea thermolimosa]GAP08557.1 threonine dehydrogenase [Anaerolinea thermolimosa]HCE17827.1 L-threonine 3-dehydrogenase [Anaerolinea thermolimosa]